MGGADEISGMADAYLKLPRADQKAKFASLSSGWTRGFDALYEAKRSNGFCYAYELAKPC